MKAPIKPRGPGCWTFVVDLGYDADGKRIRRRHTFHGLQRDAEDFHARVLNEIATGAYIDPQRLRVRDYLEQWLSSCEAKVSPKTLVRYQQIVRLHLSPALGGVLLPKLTSLHVQSYYAKALKSGRIQRKRATPKKKRRSRAKPEPQPAGLSPMTVLHHHRVLSEALKQAVRWNLVIRNVCDAVQPPKPAREPMRTLDAKEVHGLLGKAEGTRLHLPILLAVHTGMRRGELLALRWRNIDLDAKTLSCVESLQWVNGAALFKQPKTQRGRRVVMLSETAIAALRKHHTDQAAARLLQGKDYRDGDLVFAGERGEPWNPESFASSWQRFIGKTDYRVRFHDLRHTCATLLLGQGVHPKVVSEMLGHSTVAITLDTYSHVLPSMQEDAVQRLEAALSLTAEEGS